MPLDATRLWISGQLGYADLTTYPQAPQHQQSGQSMCYINRPT